MQLKEKYISLNSEKRNRVAISVFLLQPAAGLSPMITFIHQASVPKYDADSPRNLCESRSQFQTEILRC
jgi:hypothetical protein